MDIIKPIFILGVARSGTTILNRLFIAHKDTGYFENYSSRYYRQPYMFRFIPLLKKYQKLRYGIDRPEPSEGWVFDRYFRHLDYLDESMITDEMRKYYTKAIKYQLKAFNAKRFVNKNPRNCLRIKWINNLFPNSYFIVIRRDSKPIINSMYEQLKKWKNDPIEKNADLRYRDSGYGHIIKKLGGNNDIEVCFNYYKKLKDSLDNDISIIKDRTIEIQYENFVQDPKTWLKKLYNFTELEWYDDLENIIPDKLLLDNDHKWKKLPENERNLLENLTG